MFKIVDNNMNAHLWQAPCFESANESFINHEEGSCHQSHQSKEEKSRQTDDEAFAKGYKDGVAQGSADVNDKAARLVSLMNTMARPLDDLDKKVVDELVELSMTVVRHMVRRELKTSPDEIVVVIKEALSLLPIASSNVHLELHPEDALIVREALGTGEAESWKITEAPLMSRGGCRVLTENSCIDATVENRLNTAITSVMGSERHEDLD